MWDARQAALELAWRLVRLPELVMRRSVIGRLFAESEPLLVVETLHELCVQAHTSPGPPFPAALLALAQALDDQTLLPYELRSILYAEAKLAGRDEVARLFFAAGPPPADLPGDPNAERTLGRGAGEYRGRALTLGERKSLARGGRRDLLQHLMRDPSAAVIRVLLGNPRLTERDVLFIASRRPVRGDVLHAVFESTWVQRYDVKRALVQNPYTPSDLAVRLVATLNRVDLRMIASDMNLHEAVRAQAASLLAT